MKTESQNKRILDYLKRGKSLTPLQALKLFDCWALSSRISNLNANGRIIKSELVTVKGGKKVSKYSMI